MPLMYEMAGGASKWHPAPKIDKPHIKRSRGLWFVTFQPGIYQRNPSAVDDIRAADQFVEPRNKAYWDSFL